MDAIITERTNHLLSLVRKLENERATLIFPGGLDPLIAGIQKLAPNALICLLIAGIPNEIRLASAAVVVAILLDTDHLQRYGLVLSLGFTPVNEFIQPILTAVDQEGHPDEIRRLSRIASRQIYFAGCNTYACALLRIISSRNLLVAITGYAH